MRAGSHLNAWFKGDREQETLWFSLGATLPGISMSAWPARVPAFTATAGLTRAPKTGQPESRLGLTHFGRRPISRRAGLIGWLSPTSKGLTMGIKQPMLGVAAAVLVMAIALGFISLFSFPMFAGWVSFFLICCIPMQVITVVIWGCKQPPFAAQRGQPLKGVLLLLVALVAGTAVAAIHEATVGGSVSPPPPMAAMCIITSVIVAFWMAIMWGGWPFTTLIKNPLGAGLALLAACYVVNIVQFRLLFNYGFMQGAPVYVPALDPHGLFNAWTVMVFEITALAVMFLFLNFDLWPLTTSAAIMKQPVLGLVWTAVALMLGAAAFYIGVNVAGMDVVAFMVKVPIPFIFGTIMVLNMMQASLFSKLAQPLKGVLNTIASTVIGLALAGVYSALAPTVTGTVQPGPPSYDFEIWLASALLGVTFPFLIYYAEFFQMWPLQKAQRAQAAAAD
jgi:hypothetical protein